MFVAKTYIRINILFVKIGNERTTPATRLALVRRTRHWTAMTSFPFAIIGFDLDGTLFDSSIELSAALNHALASDGLPPIDPGDVRHLIGMGARQMVRRALAREGVEDEARVNRLFPILIEFYEANLGSDCPAFPGLFEAMDAMAAAGVTFAVVTNKFEHLAKKLIANLGHTARFATIIGGDTMGPGRGKPQPDPIHEMIRRCGGGRAAFVGDSIYDVQAAQAAGIPVVALSFGFLDQPASDLGADAVIDHYDELIPALRALGSG